MYLETPETLIINIKNPLRRFSFNPMSQFYTLVSQMTISIAPFSKTAISALATIFAILVKGKVGDCK